MTFQDDMVVEEGDVAYVYKDTRNLDTIGIGFLVDQSSSGRLPKEVRDFWFAYLNKKNEAELDGSLPWWRTLPEPWQRGIKNLQWNVGLGGLLGFRKMLAALQSRDGEEAAKQVLDSTISPNRAHRIAQLFRA